MSHSFLEHSTQPGLRVSEYIRVPLDFVDPLNEYWLTANSYVVAVRLFERSREPDRWAELGSQIIKLLLPLGTDVGVYGSGSSFPEAVFFSALSSIANSSYELGHVSRDCITVEWRSTPREDRRGNYRHMDWLSIQATQEAHWLETLWPLTKTGDIYDYSCVLLLAIYGESMEIPEPVSLDFFWQSLGRTIAWMVPLSDNDGFLIGIADSSVASRLGDELRLT